MRRLSQRDRDEIVEAYRAGETSTAIGRRYGVNSGWVRKLAARAGVVVKPHRETSRTIRKVRETRPRPFIITPKHIGSGRHSSAGYLKLI